MNKIKKLLKKLSKKERAVLLDKITILQSGEANNFNVKKIKESIFYRLRVKNLRIFFHYKDEKLVLDDIRPKDKNTYKNLPKKINEIQN